MLIRIIGLLSPRIVWSRSRSLLRLSHALVGPEIYFVGGYLSSMWILDTRSGKWRQGPSSRVTRRLAGVGLVDEKIYMFGGCKDKEIQAEVFDTKTQTWEVSLKPNIRIPLIWMSVVSPSLYGKIYSRTMTGQVIVYDPRDGKCEKIELQKLHLCSTDVCVIENILYIYSYCVGLMWYDSKDKEWKMVNGLKVSEYSESSGRVVIAEYNGKLVFLQQRFGDKEIWCAMIALDRIGVEITGKVEWSDRVLSLSDDYAFMGYCCRTD